MSRIAALQCIVSFPERLFYKRRSRMWDRFGGTSRQCSRRYCQTGPRVVPPGVASRPTVDNRGQLVDAFASARDAVDARFANQSVRRVRSSP
jgi:hypothetical protein